MKTNRLRALAVALLVAAFATAAPAGKDGIKPPGKFVKENTDIRNDIADIKSHRNELKDLKAECKADRKADRDMEVIMDRKEIKKTKADLKQAKAYLRADKKDLKQDHKLAMKERRKEIRETKKDLREARRELKRSEKEGKDWLIDVNHDKVAALEKRLSKNKAYLAQEKDNLTSDLAAINREMTEEDQFVGTVYTSTAYARVKDGLKE